MIRGTKQISWSQCDHWCKDESSIHHESRCYFTVKIVCDGSKEHVVIDQPEIGILGLVMTGSGSDRRWLLQYKAEPGNIEYVQFGPTVQATKSNYERVHRGKPTLLLELFTDPATSNSDVLGSEQGDRFLNKFNRNCQRSLTEMIEAPGNARFSWFSNSELKEKLKQDYTINTDARSVLATGPWKRLTNNPQIPFLNTDLPHTMADSFNKSYCSGISDRVSKGLELLQRTHQLYPIHHEQVSFQYLRQHELLEDGIYDMDGNRKLGYFDCHFPDREITHWQQPLLERKSLGQYLLLFTMLEGQALFYVAACPELGFQGRVEFGPSLQTEGSVFRQSPEAMFRVLEKAEIILNIHQSDEGGRFYQIIGHYVIAQWHSDRSLFSTNKGCWFSLSELESLSRQKGVFNNELRTLLSLLLAII